jgi:uncharacterized protein YneF (UPF0154 family)
MKKREKQENISSADDYLPTSTSFGHLHFSVEQKKPITMTQVERFTALCVVSLILNLSETRNDGAALRLTTDSEVGWIYKVSIAYQPSVFGGINVMDIMQRVNDITAAASNIHVQVLKVKQGNVECKPGVSDAVQALFTQTAHVQPGNDHCSGFYFCKGDATGDENLMFHNKGKFSIIPTDKASTLEDFARLAASAIFQQVNVYNFYKTQIGCNCPDCPGDYRQCLSDTIIKKSDGIPTSLSASSCFNSDLTFYLNSPFSDERGECLKSPVEPKFSWHNIYLNGLTEKNPPLFEEKCECSFKNVTCQKTCHKGRKGEFNPPKITSVTTTCILGGKSRPNLDSAETTARFLSDDETSLIETTVSQSNGDELSTFTTEGKNSGKGLIIVIVIVAIFVLLFGGLAFIFARRKTPRSELKPDLPMRSEMMFQDYASSSISDKRSVISE